MEEKISHLEELKAEVACIENNFVNEMSRVYKQEELIEVETAVKKPEISKENSRMFMWK